MSRSPVRVVVAARHTGVVLLAKLIALAAIALPLEVVLPVSTTPVPLDALFPLAFALPSAVVLLDPLSWLAPRPSPRYASVTLLAVSSPSLIVVATTLIAGGADAGTGHAVSTALVAETVAFVVAMAGWPRWAWVAATAIGIAAVVDLPIWGLFVYEIVPLPVSICAWVLAVIGASTGPGRAGGRGC